MKRLQIIIPVLIVSSLLIGGCYYDVEEELYGVSGCDTSQVTYQESIAPIISSNCLACHAGPTPSANINLDGYANLKPWIDNGKFQGSVNHVTGFSPMPKNSNKLSDCDLAKIRIWVDQGTQNN